MHTHAFAGRNIQQSHMIQHLKHIKYILENNQVENIHSVGLVLMAHKINVYKKYQLYFFTDISKHLNISGSNWQFAK